MSSEDPYAPKYARIITALRARIADGTYPVGSQLPSESQLLRDFGTSRPTIVRALNEMALRGEITREHGRGSFVNEPPAAEVERSRPGLAVLDRHETEEAVKVVAVVRQVPPQSVAEALGLAKSAPVLLRRSVGVYDSIASELVSLWAPLDVAKAAGLDQAGLLPVPVRRLLRSGLSDRLVRVDERVSARSASSEERELLDLAPDEPVLVVAGSVISAAGRTVLVVEVVLPGTLHELEDSYPI